MPICSKHSVKMNFQNIGSKWTKLSELTDMGHMTNLQVREKKLVPYSRNYRTDKKNWAKNELKSVFGQNDG